MTCSQPHYWPSSNNLGPDGAGVPHLIDAQVLDMLCPPLEPTELPKQICVTSMMMHVV